MVNIHINVVSIRRDEVKVAENDVVSIKNNARTIPRIVLKRDTVKCK